MSAKVIKGVLSSGLNRFINLLSQLYQDDYVVWIQPNNSDGEPSPGLRGFVAVSLFTLHALPRCLIA